MTTIAFAKYHGLGNDFIIVDALDDGTLAGTDWPGLAPRWCDRRLGIGADGILVLVPGASDTDLEMRVFNADGTRAQMCGNGVRCVALYMADRRGHRGKGLRISTLAGRIDVTWATGLGGKRAVRVDMGPPGLESADLPVRTNRDRVVDVPLGELAGESTDGSGSDAKKIQVALEAFDAASEGGTARVTCVSMGNPHAVVFVRDAGATPMESIGPVVEHLGAFPDRMNVHAAQAVGRGMVIARTWERGAGLTRACGTGACAVVVAGILTGRLDRRVIVRLPGGDLDVEWPGDSAAGGSGGVIVIGPAEEVYLGRASLDAGGRA